jgi:putative ABC transport system substrate-binding protein
MRAAASRSDATAPAGGRRAVLRALLGAGALSALACPLVAAGAELRVLVGSPGETTGPIATALARRFPQAQVSADVHALAARSGPGLYVAVGPSALQAALQADVAGPLVSVFVSSEAYQRLTSSASPRRARPVTAVFAEAAPAAQMQLIRRLYRRKVLVGVLLSPTTRHLQALIERAASGAELAVSFEVVEPGASPIRALATLSSATVLLAVPDPELYNAQAVRFVLESTYRRRQGVIGFSRAMVNAGTLGAAYASIDDVVAQLGDMVDALAAGRTVEAQYPQYWRVAINDSVARSLDVIVDASARELGNSPA